MSQAKYDKAQMANGCPMYDACPICFNCINKAPHLYERCMNCQVPHDAHTHKQRSIMIRRENFAITVTPETGEKLKKMVEESKKRHE